MRKRARTSAIGGNPRRFGGIATVRHWIYGEGGSARGPGLRRRRCGGCVGRRRPTPAGARPDGFPRSASSMSAPKKRHIPVGGRFRRKSSTMIAKTAMALAAQEPRAGACGSYACRRVPPKVSRTLRAFFRGVVRGRAGFRRGSPYPVLRRHAAEVVRWGETLRAPRQWRAQRRPGRRTGHRAR